LCVKKFQIPRPPSLLRLPFLLKNMLVARKQGYCAQKASAGKELCPEILVRFRKMGRAARAMQIRNKTLNSSFIHSTFRIPHSAFWLPARSKKRIAPHGFCAQGPCFRAGQGLICHRLYAYLEKSERE
jgi:hypothetical protein